MWQEGRCRDVVRLRAPPFGGTAFASYGGGRSWVCGLHEPKLAHGWAERKLVDQRGFEPLTS